MFRSLSFYSFLIGVYILLSFCSIGSAKYVKGTLNDPLSDWVFINRFCFLSELGELRFQFSFPVEYSPVALLLYYDTYWPEVYKTDKDGNGQLRILLYFDDQWPSVYKNKSKTCRQKEAVLNPDNNQIVYLTEREGWSGCTQYREGGISWMKCQASKSFLSARERWWYVVASQCDSVQTCFEKQQPPYIVPENGQVFVLMEGSYCSFLLGNNRTLTCSAVRKFKSARERWWFLAVARCYQDTLLGLSLNYEIWMTNGPEGDLFHRQFSADEFYILEVDIAFLMAISVLVVLSLIVAVILRKKRMFHTTFKLYMVSLFFEFFHLLVMCISYGKYANDGMDNYGSKTFGRVLEAVSVLIFILMLILMAKGFTITRGRLSVSGSVKIAVFMTIYVITYIILFIYEATAFDPGLVLYLYESPAGYGLLTLRLIAWLWFCYAIFFTLKHFPGKSKFYYPFFIFYTFWFWATVVVILVANFAIAKWVREKVVNGIECSISFAGLAAFLPNPGCVYLFTGCYLHLEAMEEKTYHRDGLKHIVKRHPHPGCELYFLTRPSNANKNFPYHARTTQVGDMGSTDAGNGATTENQFGYGPAAAVEASGISPNFTALFTVSSGRSSQYQVKTADNFRPANHTAADGTASETTWRNGNFFITEKNSNS